MGNLKLYNLKANNDFNGVSRAELDKVMGGGVIDFLKDFAGTVGENAAAGNRFTGEWLQGINDSLFSSSDPGSSFTDAGDYSIDSSVTLKPFSL